MINQKIVDELTKLAELYKQDSSLKFKYSAINKAIVYIKQYPYEIKSGEYAKENISNIGKGIAERIDEIISTGTLSELSKLSKQQGQPIDNPVEILKSITGVGDTRAQKLVKMGITTISEYKKAIKEGRVKSTHHIDIGLKYYDNLKERIPREEIDNLKKVIDVELKNIDSDMIYDICGSYRRGKKTCGDIDVLITNPKNNVSYLGVLVNRLTKKGFLIDHLTSHGDKKYMGICKGNRRIDIRYVEYTAYYAALIYFTGSKNFNIQIRNKAIELGYSLNEYGLKDKKSNKLIILHSEKEIFELLGIEYVRPEERDI